MFRRTSQYRTLDGYARAWPAPRNPMPEIREATYQALKRAFGDKPPVRWPDPRHRWDRVLRINPLLRRMNAAGHPVPARIDVEAFARDRRLGQGLEDAGGYAWRSWQAGFRWVPERAADV